MKRGDGQNHSTESEVLFYTPRFYAFDSFSAFSVFIWDTEFPTVEHAYQWKKFLVSAPELATQILAAKNPHAVKRLSDASKDKTPDDWSDRKLTVMEEILRAKLVQHDKVKELLVESGDREIIENSPVDSFWGTGPDGQGQNHLGVLWMKLRDEL